MLVDITLKITPDMVIEEQEKEKRVLVGHIGTHFDVMNKEFPLEYTQREAIIFDISQIKDRDIEIEDIELEEVHEDMFVAFYSGFIEKEGYGGGKAHPQLSNELIDALLNKKISIIGVDFGGIRRGKEHPIKDQYCADRGVFIVENLYGLSTLIKYGTRCKIYTFPMNYAQMSGLPCRVIANI